MQTSSCDFNEVEKCSQILCAQLYSLLCEYHDAFVLEQGEQGETALVQMKVDTGDAMLVPATPFAARQEIAT